MVSKKVLFLLYPGQCKTGCMEADCQHQVKITGQPDVNHIESVIDIIRNFADGLHHAKEENLLFPALGEKGYSATQGPVAGRIMVCPFF